MKKRILAFVTAILMSANTVLAADGFWLSGELEASVRDVYGELGKDVEWDAETKTVSVDDNIFISADGITANGEDLGGNGHIIGGRMYAPAELLAKSLGADYTENDESAEISFDGKKAVVSPNEESESGWKYGGGKPWVDSNLKENIDKNVSLKDDFNMAVNADWMLKTEIPADSMRYMKEFGEDDIINDNIKKLLTDKTLTGKDAEIVQSYYAALLDWDARESLADDVKADIEQIEDISSLDELNDYLLYTDEETKYPYSPYIQTLIDIDIKDTAKYVFIANEPSLILGDSAEYDEMSDYGEKIYEGKKQLVEKIMARYGYTKEQADEYYEDAIDFDALMAPAIFTNDEQNSPDIFGKIYRYTTYDELYKAAGEYPLKALVEGSGLGGSKKVVEATPGYTAQIGKIYIEDNLDIIKANLIINDVLASAAWTDKASLDDYYDYVKSVAGIEAPSYEKYAVSMVRSAFSDIIAKLYVEKYTDERVKQEVTELCHEIIGEYKLMLSENDWLTEETKKKAIEKLDCISLNVAYPDKYKDYSSLDLKGKDLDDILEKLVEYSMEEEKSNINGTVDRTYWSDGIDPLDLNACYEAYNNSVIILLGEIMAMYDPSQGDEDLYAGLGVIIGHEISHAFDPSGAQFDKDGNLNDWWSDSDRAAFKAKTQKLIDYFDKVQPYTGCSYSGDFVQGEAVADLGGMKCILKICEKKENFDYDKFFRAYASSWATLSRPETEDYLVMVDEHPLHYLRVNTTAAQFDEFVKTYDIKPGDGMYITPEDRFGVW